ncbi:MAG: hypothetical protein PHR66_08450 [Desulfuromonadaceae bacterium]|nr:hypothetical protein [Desulfuromonadaceae bacterium]
MSNPTTTWPFGMTPSDVIATSAALISLLAMAATFWQAKLARKHNALSVRPVLVFYNHLHEDKPIQLIVKNAGLGLALLKSISFSWSEHDYEHNADIFMNLAKVKKIYGVSEVDRNLLWGNQFLNPFIFKGLISGNLQNLARSH